MVKRIIKLFQVLRLGELYKRLEYRIKDIFGCFYIKYAIDNKKNKTYVHIPDLSMCFNNVSDLKEFYVFGKAISYDKLLKSFQSDRKFWRKYNLNDYADIKSIWEINRLQFLLPGIGGESITDILDKWAELNRFEYSINWTNNLEVALRAINIYLFLCASKDKKILNKYNEILYKHGQYIYNEINYSKFCIPNNHLIGEATALLILGKTYGESRWIKRAIRIYKKFHKIISSDGISIENSFSYQWFVTKMFIISLPFIDDNELYNTLSIKIKKSLHFLKIGTISNDVYLNYGDNDGGYLFSFDSCYSLGKDILKYYHLFYNGKAQDSEIEAIKQLYYINGKQISKCDEINSNYFYNNNVFIVRNDNILLFFNAKNISEHAHNDSLAINLFVDGQEVIYDSGTYCYNEDRAKREYYVSRNAHSTILFNKNNAEHIRTFRWKNNYKSYIESISNKDDEFDITGIIEKICKRNIKISLKNNTISITDTALCDGNISSNWILMNANVKDHTINNKLICIEFDKLKCKVEKVNISKNFLTENEAECYNLYGSLNNKINIIVRSKQK